MPEPASELGPASEAGSGPVSSASASASGSASEPVPVPAPGHAGAFASVPEEPPAPSPELAPAPPPASPPPEEDDAFAMLGAWVRAHPLFALLLVFISCGGPYLLWAWRASAERSRLGDLQEAWHDRLSAKGLPVPWVATAQVPAPHGIDVPGPALDPLGLGARQRALVAWQGLLLEGHVAPEKLHAPAATRSYGQGVEWLAAIRACALLRAAAQRAGPEGPDRSTIAQARADGDLAPASVREPLRLAADLLEGRLEAAGDAERLLRQSPTPAARGALLALRDEGRRRLLTRILDAPTADGLRAVALYAREGLDVVAALDSRATTLTVRDPIEADALVEVFEAAAPRGVAARPELERAWAAARAAALGAVAERLRQFEDDPAPAVAVLARAANVDTTIDAPAEGFLGWRTHLHRVVNDQEKLRRFAERLFELGFVPADFPELLAARGVRWSGSTDSIGALLGESILATAHARSLRDESRLGSNDFADLLRRLDATSAALEQRLGPRQDEIARRLRAQLAFQQGRARVPFTTLEGFAGGVERFARARELGYEPLHRLQGELAQLEAALGHGERAIAVGRERVETIDALAKRLSAGLTPTEVVAWELRGWPVEPRTMDGERVSARLDLAALLADQGRADEALALATQATTFHVDHAARAHLARAELLLAERRTDDAREALRQGLEVVAPHERALRDRIQSRLDALPPR